MVAQAGAEDIAEIIAPKGISNESLDRLLAQGLWVEIQHGEIIDTMPSTQNLESHTVAGNAYFEIRLSLREYPLGAVHTDGLLYVLQRNAQGGIELGDIPDVSFIRTERLPTIEDFSRLSDSAPDLAIEVVSPTNEAEDLLERVDHYLQYGGEEVWLLYPTHKRVHRYRRDDLKHVRVYYAEDTLDAAPLLPGLQIKVSDLFVLRRP